MTQSIAIIKETITLILIIIFFCSCNSVNKSNTRFGLYGYDAIARLGEVITLRTKLEKSNLTKEDVQSEIVMYYYNDTLIGQAKTTDDGISQIKYKFNSSGIKRIKPSIKGISYPEFIVIVYEPENKFVISDIDSTLTSANWLTVAFQDNNDAVPLPNAIKAMKKLSEKYYIIYLTYRDDFFYMKTKQWLRDNKMPEGVLITSDFGKSSLFSSKYKNKAIRSLGINGLIAYGFGDKEGDGEAYKKNEITPFIISNDKTGFIDGIYYVNGWDKILRLIDEISK